MALNISDKSADTNQGVFNARPKGAASIGGVLIHATASTSESGDFNWLSGSSLASGNPVSIHYLLKRNGNIIRVVRDELRAWHAGFSMWKGRPDCNSWMIGIEICNDNVGEEFTDKQYESLAQLIALLTVKWPIPDDCVVSHAKVRAQWLALHPGSAPRKTDPKDFDFDRMWKRVHEIREGAEVPSTPTSRTFPETGRTMSGKFLAFFEAHGDVNQFGYPVSDELSESLGDANFTVQYTQRARFEDHGAEVVMLGLVGVESFVGRGGVPGTAEITSDDVQQFYDSHGGVPILGLPISSEHVELLPVAGIPRPFIVQYFQRSRIERHPKENDANETSPNENTPQGDMFMLGLVGAEAFALKH